MKIICKGWVLMLMIFTCLLSNFQVRSQSYNETAEWIASELLKYQSKDEVFYDKDRMDERRRVESVTFDSCNLIITEKFLSYPFYDNTCTRISVRHTIPVIGSSLDAWNNLAIMLKS
ncbi:MAG: hypothetical protein QM734_15495 [Cyclobacteriaceae bacterium]